MVDTAPALFPVLQVSPPGPADVPASYRGSWSAGQVLEWSFVESRLESASYYWLVSASCDRRPHAVPLWGIYVEGRVCVDGHPAARWMRNLDENPEVVVHLPDAERVVIVSAVAERLEEDALAGDGWKRLDGLYRTKYGVPEGSPWLVVHPRKVVAWDGTDLATMTRWFVHPVGD